MKRTLVLGWLVLAGLTGFSNPAAGQLVIVPTFDVSITSSPDAVAIMAGINNAIAQVSGIITNPITTNITFKGDESIGLGQSSTSVATGFSYASYRLALTTNQTLSANDTAALATIPAGPNNPVNGSTGMTIALPLLRALGFVGAPSGADSTISLKMSLMNFLRTGPQDPLKYDLEQVTLHEIVEVLASGGGGSALGNAGTDVGTLDLYRFSAPGVRSFSTAAPSSYFSIDNGTTNLSFFNQTSGGDYGDWNGAANSSPQASDAFSTPGLQLNLSSAEILALDVVGWNVSAVPEPSSMTLAATLVTGICVFRRFRRKGGSARMV